ncbi:hypothetical protein Emag_006922 [Eimeria magna]
MKGQVEDSPAVKEIWGEWPSSFAKLERQWEDIYLAEFPEVTAAPRWGTSSWRSFLTGFSTQFVARPSARVREVRGWKEIPEYEPKIQPDPNPVIFMSSALQALGCLLARRARHDEEDSDELVEARPALPTHASSGVSAELEGSADLPPLPAPRAPGSGRAAPQTAPTSPAAPPPGGPERERPLEPLSPTTTVAFDAVGALAAQGWERMATRCVWWTLAAAREYRAARESFEYRLQELQWVDSPSRMVATAHAVSRTALVDQLPREELGGPAVTEDQVKRLVGFWLSSAERLAALVGPDSTALREFLNGVYRAGQALLGMRVASTAFPSSPGKTTPPPPLPDLGAEEFRLPESAVTARNPPQQLGMYGLLNGSAGRSPADDATLAPVGQETGSAAELSETEQPAPKRPRSPGR